MQLTTKAIIAPAKLTKYLLKFQLTDDKSKFLGQAGYNLSNWTTLEEDLRSQILPLPATFTEASAFGNKYEIRGTILGPDGVSLWVITIWMIEYATQNTKFITLFPDKDNN